MRKVGDYTVRDKISLPDYMGLIRFYGVSAKNKRNNKWHHWLSLGLTLSRNNFVHCFKQNLTITKIAHPLMRRIAVRFILSLSLLVMLSAVGLSLLLANIDLNRVKPQIQQLVYQQSRIALAIDGSIDWVIEWQGLPSVSLSMTQARAYLETPLEALANPKNNALADIQHITLGLSLAELFYGRIHINELKVSNVSIDLIRDKQGIGNWQAIAAPLDNTNVIAVNSNDKMKDKSSTANDSSSVIVNAIVINQLQLDNIRIDYQDTLSGSQQAIHINALNSKNLNLQGKPFSLALQATTQSARQHPLSITFNSQLSLNGFLIQADNHSPQIIASDIHAELKKITAHDNSNKSSSNIDNDDPLQSVMLKGDASYRLKDHAFTLDDFHLTNAASTIHLTLNGLPSSDNKIPSLTLAGNIKLTTQPLHAQLKALGIQTPEALNDLSLNAEISGLYKASSQRLSLANINARFDNSDIDGAISILLPDKRHKKTPTISALLNIDQLNLDHYQQLSTNNNTISTHSTANDQLPFEYLDIADALLTVNIDTLTVNHLIVNSLATGFEVTDGDIKQAIFKGKFYQSAMNATAQVERGNTQPHIQLNSTMTGLNVATVLTAIRQASNTDDQLPPVLSGTAHLDTSLQLKGHSLKDWKKSLSGKTQFTVSHGFYASDNIEYRVCQAVARIRKTQLQKDWPSNTALENLSTTIHWHNGVGQLTTFNGGLKNIGLSGTGAINLPKQFYHVDMDAIIYPAVMTKHSSSNTRRNSQSDPACAVNKKYRDIAWPIQCSGSFTFESGSTDNSCKVNQQRLRKLIKTVTKKEAQNKINDVINKELDKHLGDPVEGELRDLIKSGLEGLFR